MITLAIVGALASDAIVGAANAPIDLLVMVAVVLTWDYIGNLAEYCFPRFRSVAQDTPTLLIHEGRVLERAERRSPRELLAALHKQGIAKITEVRQAIQEVDGRINVISTRVVPE